jgi:ABC-type branched-subunit amino acid transport system ATPase component
MTTAKPALIVSDLSVHFAGVFALDKVSLSVSEGTIHGIIGPNGSGKTTLLNALSGFVPCSGEATLFGKPILRLAPHKRAGYGLGRTFQNPKVDHSLTVRDVLRIGEHQRRMRPFWKEAFAPWLADADAFETEKRALALCSELGIVLPSLDVPLASTPHGTVKMLDLARALMGEPRVVLLDESTSGLSQVDISMMHDQLSRLRAKGVTIVVVEHNVRFLSDVCDHVTVLDAGRCIAAGSIAEVLRYPQVLKAYMGEDALPEEQLSANLF